MKFEEEEIVVVKQEIYKNDVVRYEPTYYYNGRPPFKILKKTIIKIIKAPCNFVLCELPNPEGLRVGWCNESHFRKATIGEKFLYTINNGPVIPEIEGE